MRAAKELGLCSEDAAASQIVTRGETTAWLHRLLTGQLVMAPPPLLGEFPISLTEAVDVNRYLVELSRVPKPILEAFKKKDWICRVEFDYLEKLSQTYNMTCVGATDYNTNMIYLAQVEHALPPRSSGASILEPCAKPAGLEESENFEQSAETMPEAPIREQKEQVLMRQSDTSRPGVWGVSGMPLLQPSNTYKKPKEKKNIEIQSVCPPGRTEWADRLVLEQILEGCEREALKPDECLLFTDAIGWLFYTGEVCIGPWCYPQGYVRSRLHLLDYEMHCDAAQELAENRTRIRGNALSYAAKVVFSCLIEHEAGLSLDPALNEMKRQYIIRENIGCLRL